VQAFVSRKHETDLVVVYERAGIVFAFNFHPSQSYTNYKVGVQIAGTYPLHVTGLCSYLPQTNYTHSLCSYHFFLLTYYLEHYYCIIFLYDSIVSCVALAYCVRACVCYAFARSFDSVVELLFR